MDRRVFLELFSQFTSGAFLMPLLLPAPKSSYHHLSDREAEVLYSIGEVIIPPRPGHPTVRDVNAVAYMDREIPSEQWTTILSGLKKLESEFRSLASRKETFAGIWKRADAHADFLRQLRSHFVDAYYSDPQVWKAIGFGGRAQFVGYPDFRDKSQMKH